MEVVLPESENERLELVNLVKRRYRMSSSFFKGKFEIWTRCYKIYRALADYKDDSDEPNLFIPYAFGIVEDIVARMTEPIFQKLPIRPRPKRRWHEKQAKSFYNMCRSYFSSRRYQAEKTESVREKIITGNAWEIDEYANEYVKGRKWKMGVASQMINGFHSIVGKFIDLPSKVKYDRLAEVPHLYPKRVGYQTRFPSVFRCLPEPRIKRVEDMHWFVYEEEEVALDDLKKQMYKHPETKQMLPVYDLTELETAIGAHEPGGIKPQFDERNTYADQIGDILAGRSGEHSGTKEQDMDKVHLLHCYEPTRIITIAQGRYVIRVIKDPFHYPRIPARLDIYTPDKENLYGLGALEPVEDLFYELNDIHRLSMRSWIRIIQGMLLYHEDAIPHMDDFKPGAGNKIRVSREVAPNIAQAIMEVQQGDPTSSMITQESNIKGLLERIISLADLSPGVEGTKQYHKTATGLLEIQTALAKRFAMMRRTQMGNYQDQMAFMYSLYDQFMFDKLPFTEYRDDSQTSTVDYTRDNIYTDGEGFDYMVEEDPSFGDNVVQRNQLMILLELAMKYETFRVNSKDPTMLKLDVAEFMRRVIEAFGWTYPGNVLKPPEGTLTPEAELEMIMAGISVRPNPKENLSNHLVDHLLQKISPRMVEGFQKGAISPEVMAALDAHIDETLMLLTQLLANPMAAAQAKMKGMFEDAAVTGGPSEGMAPAPPIMTPKVGVGGPGGAGLGIGPQSGGSA